MAPCFEVTEEIECDLDLDGVVARRTCRRTRRMHPYVSSGGGWYDNSDSESEGLPMYADR